MFFVFVEDAEEMGADRGGMYPDGFADLLGAVFGESDVAQACARGQSLDDALRTLGSMVATLGPLAEALPSLFRPTRGERPISPHATTATSRSRPRCCKSVSKA